MASNVLASKLHKLKGADIQNDLVIVVCFRFKYIPTYIPIWNSHNSFSLVNYKTRITNIVENSNWIFERSGLLFL